MTWGTKSRQARGYGRQWELLRLQALRRDGYVCQPCLRKGRIHAGNEVDHIVPKAKGGRDELSNLQTIAAACHREKTRLENGAQPKIRIGVDGYPCSEE